MNYGVKMQGDVYFFLHADSEPTSHFDVSQQLMKAMTAVV
jgi:hypothetical protein